MRAVLQRVSGASVTIRPSGEVRTIGPGLVVLLGVRRDDGEELAPLLAKKTAQLRVFEDENGVMNLSCQDLGRQVLVVSNFTLFADCTKGRRPSYQRAAQPELAEPAYRRYIAALRGMGLTVATGEFGAQMELALVNDGPVTILLDTDELIHKPVRGS